MNKTDTLKVVTNSLIVGALLFGVAVAEEPHTEDKSKPYLDMTVEEKKAYRQKVLEDIEAREAAQRAKIRNRKATLMTQEAKAKSLASFHAYENNAAVEKKSHKLKNRFEEQQFKEKYIRGDKHGARVCYDNSAKFPTKYGGASGYEDNDSALFLAQMDEVIAIHFLGADYKQYSPTVRGVTHQVCIELSFKDTEQLERILEHPEITKIRHPGNPSIEVVGY